MISYTEAIRQSFRDSLIENPKVMIFGLGVGDAGAVFNTTTNLQTEFGSERVFDVPLSENALTGMALGLSLQGFRPVMTHQRADFSFTSAEQIINQLAKFEYTSNGEFSTPVVLRMIIGRGWGQGPTHSQTVHSIFAQVPGLEIVAPASPSEGYSLMRWAIRSNKPTIFLEHRWLHQTSEIFKPMEIGDGAPNAVIARQGKNLTFVTFSIGVIEGHKIAKVFSEFGIQIEILNLRSLSPWDINLVVESVRKTTKLCIYDTGQIQFGISSEISHVVQEALFGQLTSPVLRLGLPFEPTPSSPFLAKKHYVSIDHSLKEINSLLGYPVKFTALVEKRKLMFKHKSIYEDQPDSGDVGPF